MIAVDPITSNALTPSKSRYAAHGGEPSAVLSSDWQALLGGPTLNASELAELNRMAHLRVLPVGAQVFHREEPAEHLLAVLSGSVGLGLARHDQPFHLERTVRGPGWLDLGSAWLRRSFDQDARTQTEARVLELPLAGMRNLMMREPAMLDRLMVGLARTVHSLTGVTHDLMHKDAERRLAAWLLQRSGAPESAEQAELMLGERKRDIAAQLAITPETLSRMMRQLKLKGLVEVRGYAVRLLDLPSLRQLAQD